jgi:uncharacterized protein
MGDVLPSFRYHPSPVATGSIVESVGECVSCRRDRGYAYVGPIYSADELDGMLCPWCIADGTAASRFGAEFTDVGWGVPDEVPQSVLEVLSQRTPGFLAWQQEHWLYHCGDACAFLGPAGTAELERYPEALEMIMREARSGNESAYLFRCLICGVHLAYSDAT